LSTPFSDFFGIIFWHWQIAVAPMVTSLG